MSFFKRLKDKFAKPEREQDELLQQDETMQDEAERKKLNEADTSLKPQDDSSSIDDEFDDGLISIEEFEELESQKIGAKFREGLEKSRENFQNQLNNLLAHYRKVDEDFFEALEEMLIQALSLIHISEPTRPY